MEIICYFCTMRLEAIRCFFTKTLWFPITIILFACNSNESTPQEQVTEEKRKNGIPIVDLVTENNCGIDSKDTYVDATIQIETTTILQPKQYCEIKGRGNATWDFYPKKPYKIKLKESTALFDFPANKDWILLAEYCDKSLLRTAYMCEVSKALGIEYTVNYQHVDLILNEQYTGTYLLTDNIEKGRNRIHIANDGYIIEDDNHFESEPLYFKTEKENICYTFKYPNANKGEIKKNDKNFVFIKNKLDSLESSLYKIPNDSISYKSFIDIESFAKWYIAAEVTGNWDPNLYYVLPSKRDRLKMMPMWDAEWSLGLASMGNSINPWGWYEHPYSPNIDISIWNSKKYFIYLFKDKSFRQEVKKQWELFKSALPIVRSVINRKKEEITHAVCQNFEKWPILNDYIGVGLVALGTWEAEVKYVSDVFESRIKALDERINNL